MRLHISPFSQELLPVYLGPSQLSIASNINFHTIPTFPERPYGFVDLPEMEAAKLKRKLNGTILKGGKVKIEEARKDRRNPGKSVDDDETAGAPGTKKLRKSERKRGREDEVTPGYQLPDDRKVKRGWTESSSKAVNKTSDKDKTLPKHNATQKRKTKAKQSSFRDDPECLFKTQLPPATSSTGEAKPKKKVKKGAKDGAVIHEFERNTKHPSFIRDNKVSQDKKLVQQYDDKKGWTDEDGVVIEPAKVARQQSKSAAGNKSSKVAEDNEDPSDAPLNKVMEEDVAELSQDSSNDASSASEREVEDVGLDKRSSSPAELPALHVTQSSPTDVKPHPLETLFKKPERPANGSASSNKPDLEVKIPFNFFGNDVEDEQIEKSMETPGLPRVKRAKASGLPNLSIPVTPYTQRDMQWRSQRSAAPTPDTAAPGKSGFGDIWNKLHEDREDDIEEEDEEDENDNENEGSKAVTEDSAKADPTEKQGKQESEFSEWFWEHRGDNNRAWKKRRREAAKEQRQRENRRRKKAV